MHLYVRLWTVLFHLSRLVATWAEFQHSLVYCVTDQWRKRLKACIRRKWSLWTLAMTLLAWQSSCHTSQLVLFRATDDNPQLALLRAFDILTERNKPSVRLNSFAVHKLVWWHFQLGWLSGLEIVFFWDNINNQKLLKMTFWISRGKVATSDKWGGQICKIFVSNFLRI